MAQFARPASDITNSTWTASTGATLYGCIDETPASDTDYIRATGNSQTCEVKLSSVTDPVSSGGHVLRLRAKATGTSTAEKWTVTVYQGASLIATAFSTTNVTRSSFNDYSYTLTAAQADAITNYADLRVRIVVTQGSGETIDVSFIELEVPDAVQNQTVDETASGAKKGTAAAASQVEVGDARSEQRKGTIVPAGQIEAGNTASAGRTGTAAASAYLELTIDKLWDKG